MSGDCRGWGGRFVSVKTYRLDMAQVPDLCFEVPGIPPRRTLQSGRGAYRGEDGEVHFFTKAAVRAEAWEMRAEFSRRLPEGWKAKPEPCAVSVLLVYPLRKTDRADGEELIHHAVKPDADNLVKSLWDSMTRAGVWVDDAQVDTLAVRKRRGRTPRWTVKVWFAVPTVRPQHQAKKTAPGGEEGQGRLF